MRRKKICVDFDGVLHMYTSGWKGIDKAADPPVPGAIEWLTNMVRACDENEQYLFDVCIYSSRSWQEGGIQCMKEWLLKWGLHKIDLELLYFPTEKPSPWLTIDDRCFRFEGDFPSVEWILRFTPWNKK